MCPLYCLSITFALMFGSVSSTFVFSARGLVCWGDPKVEMVGDRSVFPWWVILAHQWPTLVFSDPCLINVRHLPLQFCQSLVFLSLFSISLSYLWVRYDSVAMQRNTTQTHLPNTQFWCTDSSLSMNPCIALSGPIRVKAESVRVATNYFASINTLTFLAPCSHL